MIGVHYMSVNGGTNNLAIATDTKTGETSTSFISKEHALRALKRRLAQRKREETKA